MATARKRQRDESSDAIAAVSFQSTLASRVDDNTPAFWREAALAAGVSGTASFLVHLGRNITAAMTSVGESAEGARAQLRDTRSALHAAIDMRCDELGASINATECDKVTSLERELVAVDSALESWQFESAATLEARTMWSQATLVTMYSSLADRLDVMEAQLQALPLVVETPLLVMLSQTVSLLPSIADFGRVVTPLPVTAADLRLERVPGCRGARVGGTLNVLLSLGPRFATRSSFDIEATLGMLARDIQVEATIEDSDLGLQSHSLQVLVSSDTCQHSLIVSVAIPLALSSVETVTITATQLAGVRVQGLTISLPVQSSGVVAPLALLSHAAGLPTVPCISLQGRIYCPPGSGPEVLVFDAHGTQLPALPVASLGMSEKTNVVAYVHGDTPCLLLADCNGSSSRLVAIDPASYAVRWTSAEGGFQSCIGITAIPSLGVAIVACGGYLCAYRLSDGRRVGRFDVFGLHWFLTADASTGSVYGNLNLHDSDGGTTRAWQCAADGAEIVIKSVAPGPITAAGSCETLRPITVVPPAPGKVVAHLVVCSVDSIELLVLSLPDLALVHTHMMQGLHVGVFQLAADPWGAALAVGDFTTLHVLAWPLPGMAPLE